MNIQPRPIPIEPQAGQESVWNYPRPAIWEYTSKNLRVICQDIILAETTKGIRVLETSHRRCITFHPKISNWNISSTKAFSLWVITTLTRHTGEAFRRNQTELFKSPIPIALVCG